MSRPRRGRRELERRLVRLVVGDPLLRGLRERSRETSATLYLVGGAVRDAALGRRTDEVDLAAGPGCARLLRAIRRHWGTRGHRFRKRGVTTWRFRLDGRAVDIVDASRRGLERDLRRRDLTVNAMAFDLVGSRLIDPLGGLAALRAGRLHPAGETSFRDDPLRALRLCRFLAQLAPTRATPAARSEAARAAPSLRRVAVERVSHELDRLLAARSPRPGLDALQRLGQRQAVLPELDALPACTAGRDRPDVWTHTIDAVGLAGPASRLPGAARVSSAEDRLVLRWSLLLHDISKPETLRFAPDGRPTFHGHEELGARRADALLRRLRQPAARRRRVVRLIRLHLRPGHLADAGASAAALRRLARDAGEDLPLLALHAACDARASGSPAARVRWRRLRAVLRDLLETWDAARRAPLPRLVDGHDVMCAARIEAGPEVGRLLARVRRAQERGVLRSREDALVWLARIAARRG